MINNKRLLKNTLSLYIRMFLTLIVSLYTSRLVLNILGVEDYGIYNVVGGVVSLLSFMTSSLSGATSRFLSYELGRNNQGKLNITFSTSLTMYLILSIIIVVVLESLGLWFINNKLVIPFERFNVAIIVFHISVLSCFFQLFQLPFNAAIIARERMEIFAYISIFDVFLKLVVVYVLTLVNYDKLILYALLILCVSVLTTILYIVYACSKFEECRLAFKLNRNIAKPILQFSGWDLYGNFSVVVRSGGINILQNTFFGTIVNAAAGISNQVLSAIMGFAENFMVAVKPQIIKNYASGAKELFVKLITYSSRYSTLLLFLISFPVVLEADFILKIWLVEVPNYAVPFCQLSIINNWISIMFRPVVFGIHATGNAKRISLINGTIYLMVLPLSYVMLKLGGGPIIPFLLNILLLLIGHWGFSLRVLNKYVMEFDTKYFIAQSIFRIFYVIFPVVILCNLIPALFEQGWIRLIVSVMFSISITCFFSWLFAIEKEHKKIVLIYLKNKFTC